MPEDIQSLIARCIEYDHNAWGKFIERFSGILYYSARERLKRSGVSFSNEDIEDIVQSVFLEIWQKRRLEEVRDRDKIAAWLSIMAQTRAINYKKKLKYRLLNEDELNNIGNVADKKPLYNSQAYSDFENIISEFNPKEKIVMTLSLMHGKTHREIASFTKLSINTVSTIIARKKKALKEKLDI
ncbi:MAG: sigma-70 family RNA polymerase sigma factor [Candidatus Omnitrophota bacterium]